MYVWIYYLFILSIWLQFIFCLDIKNFRIFMFIGPTELNWTTLQVISVLLLSRSETLGQCKMYVAYTYYKVKSLYFVIPKIFLELI